MGEKTTTGTLGKRRSLRSRARRKPRSTKNIAIQISLGFLLLGLIIYLAVIAQDKSYNGAFILLSGVGFGYILQRSRFCFTAAMRDPTLTGTTELSKAVIVALILSSFLFLALNIARFGYDPEDFVQLSVRVVGNLSPVGLHTAVGAFLFGLGAVIAGGCASGTLARMGEGFLQQWVVFLFFVIGTVLGGFVQVLFYIDDDKRLFLPAMVGGWVPAIAIHFGTLLALYLLADYWGRRNIMKMRNQ